MEPSARCSALAVFDPIMPQMTKIQYAQGVTRRLWHHRATARANLSEICVGFAADSMTIIPGFDNHGRRFSNMLGMVEAP